MKGYIIVKQYTRQEHQCPKEYITELPMNNNIFEGGFGDYLYKVFLDEDEALEVVGNFNKSNPYRKVDLIEVDVL